MNYSLLLIIMSTGSLLLAKPIVIAHRGASAYEPENTLASFKKAIEMNAPMIELDVHRAKSGEIVVHHDAFLAQGTRKKIKDLTGDQIQKYNVKGQKIPLLSEVLELVDKRIMINIELKSADTVEPVAKLLQEYMQEKEWPADRFLISSFNHHWVKKFKQLVPSVKTGIIFEGNPIGLAQIAVNANAEYAIMYYEWINRDFVQDAHRRGIQVFTYTVNDAATAKIVTNLGVDGIISNYPDIFLQ